MLEINYKFSQKVERNGESRLLRGVFLLVRGNYAFCIEMPSVPSGRLPPRFPLRLVTWQCPFTCLCVAFATRYNKIVLLIILKSFLQIYCLIYFFAAATIRRRLQLAAVYYSPPFTVSRRVQFATVYSSPLLRFAAKSFSSPALLFAAVYIF